MTPHRQQHICAFILALLTASLLLPPSFALAQQARKSGSAPEMSDADKAKAVDKRNYERDTDAAYKKSLERIPDAPKPDPWGGVREAPKK